MHPERIDERLLERDLGLLDAEAARALDAHLSSCPACRRLADTHAGLTALLAAGESAPRVDVVARVRAGVATTPRRKRRAVRVAELGGAVAASAAGLALLLPATLDPARAAWPTLAAGGRALGGAARAAWIAFGTMLDPIEAGAASIGRGIASTLTSGGAALEPLRDVSGPLIGTALAGVVAVALYMIAREWSRAPRLTPTQENGS